MTLKDSTSADVVPVWTANIEERREALEKISLRIVDKFVNFSFQKYQVDHAAPHNLVLSYAFEVLNLGVFYQEFSDSIWERDGTRVLCCWRYLLPFFAALHCTNYSIKAFNLLYH